jgi:DNA polymerase III delta prime subunit
MIAANETDWSEKYRPMSIVECVLPARIRRSLDRIVSTGHLKNMIFHGSPGVGKTASANAICRDVGRDVYQVNGSLENSIDDLRNSVTFATTLSLSGSRKVVLIDEAEYLSKADQAGLRAFMEQVSSNCSFLLTANNVTKISAAIQSRCLNLDFSVKPEEAQPLRLAYSARLREIVIREQANFDAKRVAEIVASVFPDFRQILKQVQQACGQ